jgi:hypothetical protein
MHVHGYRTPCGTESRETARSCGRKVWRARPYSGQKIAALRPPATERVPAHERRLSAKRPHPYERLTTPDDEQVEIDTEALLTLLWVTFPSLWVAVHDEQVEIDTEMVPLVHSLWAKDLVTVACCQDVGESAAGSLRQQIAELTAILMDLSADETDATDLWAMCGSPGE